MSTNQTEKKTLDTAQAKARYGLRQSKIPNHIAIIMDGNGRWAKSRGLSRIRGHRQAIKTVRETTETCAELGIKYLTLYAFSTENWLRPKREVQALMRLLKEFLINERPTIMKNDIRLNTIGRIEQLPDFVQEELNKTIDLSAKNRGMILTLALSYGGRQEIIDAARKIAADVAAGKLSPEAIDEELFSHRLETDGMPDPDLLIRTSGEFRVSNFLLWQLSYSEMWITPVLWPDFRKEHIIEAIQEYSRRERRYGKVRT